jgi:hypothetical protein
MRGKPRAAGSVDAGKITRARAAARRKIRTRIEGLLKSIAIDGRDRSPHVKNHAIAIISVVAADAWRLKDEEKRERCSGVEALFKAAEKLQGRLAAVSPIVLADIDARSNDAVSDLEKAIDRLLGASRSKEALRGLVIDRGRPKDVLAARLTVPAAAAFEAMTGQPATVITPIEGGPGGDFYPFLDGLFKILGVAGGGLTQARKVRQLVGKIETLPGIFCS